MNKERIYFKQILDNEEIATYIAQADSSLASLGYTDHSFGHVKKCAKLVKDILLTFGYSDHEIDLGQIAAYMHDIGNVANRVNHAQTGAIMAFSILSKLDMSPNDIAVIMSAIGNHDEGSGTPLNPITAALILADKTDVRRSRVRDPESRNFNIHDRVNYAVKESEVIIDKNNRTLTLNILLDTTITSVMEYFEIFLSRMSMCKQAAKKLDIFFKLNINGLELI